MTRQPLALSQILLFWSMSEPAGRVHLLRRHMPVKKDVIAHGAVNRLLREVNSAPSTRKRHAIHIGDALMERQVDGTLNLDTLAASTHLSKYHFAKTYRRLTGVSPTAHFIHLKIERACRLLDSTPSSVKQIAGLLGYDDPYYFSRLFKKVMGYSPEQYRRLDRG